MNGVEIHLNRGEENVVRLQGKKNNENLKRIFFKQKFPFILAISESTCILFVHFSNETQENDDETNISQEILVLDFGDEKSEFLRSGGESDFNGGKFIK